MFNTNDLEQLMQKVEDTGWGVISLSDSLCEKLLHRFQEIESEGALKAATITHTEDRTHARELIRNDFTFWIEKSHHPTEALLLDGLDQLRAQLREYFRISLTHLECHFALYPEGHFYKKHIDQTAENNKRFFTFVIYLNSEWQPEYGGHLIGYQNGNTFKILPELGRMIVFRSDIPHEVEKSLKPRRSIAGWFRL